MPSCVEEFLDWLSGAVVVLLLLALLGFLIGPTDTTPATIGEPAYDPACVIETSTMGCVDGATYEETVRAEAERESASSPDPGDSAGRFGWP